MNSAKRLVRLILSMWLVLAAASRGTFAAQSGPNGGTAPPSAAPASVSDVAITVDGGWQAFSWTGSGEPLDSQGAFTFDAPSAVRLKVTDAYCAGDRFRVFDAGVHIGETPSVPVDVGCLDRQEDPDRTFASPGFSNGSYLLDAGHHAITLQVIENPWHLGGGFLRVDRDTVFGWVFLDRNGNGGRDADETGLARAGVTLTRGGIFSDFSRSTPPRGWYQVWGSRTPGFYCVRLDVPGGYRPITPTEVCRELGEGAAMPFQADFGVILLTYLPLVQ